MFEPAEFIEFSPFAHTRLFIRRLFSKIKLTFEVMAFFGIIEQWIDIDSPRYRAKTGSNVTNKIKMEVINY